MVKRASLDMMRVGIKLCCGRRCRVRAGDEMGTGPVRIGGQTIRNERRQSSEWLNSPNPCPPRWSEGLQIRVPRGVRRAQIRVPRGG